MKNNITAVIGWILLISGLGFYICGIVVAMFSSAITENGQVIVKIPEFLETGTISIGAILLTNLGTVLGFSFAKPNTVMALIVKSPLKIFSIPEPISMRERIQIAAVLIYIISLLGCCTFSIIKMVHNAPAAALISQFSKTFIGVVTAYVGFVLGVKDDSLKKSHTAS